MRVFYSCLRINGTIHAGTRPVALPRAGSFLNMYKFLSTYIDAEKCGARWCAESPMGSATTSTALRLSTRSRPWIFTTSWRAARSSSPISAASRRRHSRPASPCLSRVVSPSAPKGWSSACCDLLTSKKSLSAASSLGCSMTRRSALLCHARPIPAATDMSARRSQTFFRSINRRYCGCSPL